MSTNPDGYNYQYGSDRSRTPPSTSQYSQQLNQPQPGTIGQQEAITIPKITREDMKIFKECQKESFYQRCVPFGIAGCAAIYALGRQQIIVPQIWKYALALGFGFFAGKVSYRKKCEEKFVKSNLNTPFANMVRQRYQKGTETLPYTYGATIAPTTTGDETWGFAPDYQSGQELSGFAPDTQAIPELDLGQRLDQELAQPEKDFSTTYDDLRQRNRASVVGQPARSDPRDSYYKPLPQSPQRPPY